MLEDGLTGLILSNQSIVGSIGNRLFALYLPPDSILPAITYTPMGAPPETTFENAVLQQKRIQFDIWTGDDGNGNVSTFANAKGIEKALFALLHGFSGTLTDAGATRVLHCLRGETIDNFSSPARWFRVMNEYEITYVD